MSDKLPFEGGGLPQDDDAVPGLPFAPSSEAPPLPFALNDEPPAPMPFALDAEPAIPPLPFSLEDDEPAPTPHFSLEAEPQAPALPFLANEAVSDPFSLDEAPQIPALPFSLDDEPAVAARPEAETVSLELESRIPPLPFSLDDEEPAVAAQAEALPFLQAAEPDVVAEPAPAAAELSGAGFLFEEGEIDSPLFRRLAQQEEARNKMPQMGLPAMPPMGVPAMPPVAKAPAAEPPSPPPFPPVYEPARPAAESATSRPVPPPVSASAPPSPPPPPPGYQPPPPPPYGNESASRPVPPAIPTPQAPAPMAPPAYQPPPVTDLSQQPSSGLTGYEPMQPAANSKAPILTGDAVPQHDAPPVAKDVSSALAAMKARLASSRQQPDPNASLLKDPTPEYGMDMSLAPKSSKPPEIWDYRVGQSIFREGELTYELFMLMEGIVDIYVGGDKVATLNAETAAGAYLGEIGALLRLPRTATVKAVTSCKFLVFPDAKRLFEEDPEFGIKLSTILAQRLAKSNESMEMVMRALYRAKVKDDVISAVKGAFQGKESTFVGKRGLFR